MALSRTSVLTARATAGRTDKLVAGIDVSENIDGKWYWFGQYLWNRWADFLDPATDYEWSGAFAGVEYLHSEKWVFSALVNHIDAGDFKNTDTVYEGLDIRNVKGVIEANIDLLDDTPQTGQYFTGHLSQENYTLIGIDAALCRRGGNSPHHQIHSMRSTTERYVENLTSVFKGSRDNCVRTDEGRLAPDERTHK